jgi:phage terminase large subunit GpA-like protein
MPGRGGRLCAGGAGEGRRGLQPGEPGRGPTYVDATDGGKRLRRGARLWTVAVSTFKAETYRFLRLERPTDEERGRRRPLSGRHHPSAAWIDSEWCKQLVAEQLVTVKTKRGFARLEWQKLRERNEALDCRVYARAAAWIAAPIAGDRRKWRDLERCSAARRSRRAHGRDRRAAASAAGVVRRPHATP